MVNVEGNRLVADFEAVYKFLREHYLHSRFEGRNGSVWGADYSRLVAKGTFDHLAAVGSAWISPYESRLGRAIHFDVNLNILNPDEPPAQLEKKAGNLTHIYGAGW